MKLESILSPLGDTITGPADLLGSAKPSVFFRPMVTGLRPLLSGDPDKMISDRTIRVRKVLHPILMKLLPLFAEYKQVIESKNALLGIDEPDAPVQIPEGTAAIWCPTHGFKDDVVATLSVARHAYILFGSLPQFFNTFDGVGAWINGSVMCNRKVKKSKQASVEAATRLLRQGVDLLLYPEGVWNKTPDKLILPLWPGAYRMARETGSVIVPVIHYLADPHKKYPGNVIHTVVADPIRVDNLEEAEALELLRDTMATWYFLLMEKYGRSTRAELLEGFRNAEEAWEHFLTQHVGAITYYDKEIELIADYRPKTAIRPETVWQAVAKIRNITPANAAHAAHAHRLIAQEIRRDFQRRF